MYEPRLVAPREGNESPQDSQRNEHGEQEWKSQPCQNQTDKHRTPQHEQPDSRKDKYQQGCGTKQSNQRDDQASCPNRVLERSGHLLPVDDNGDGIALQKHPPGNDSQHKDCQRYCQFLCHHQFLSRSSNLESTAELVSTFARLDLATGRSLNTPSGSRLFTGCSVAIIQKDPLLDLLWFQC